MSARELAQLRNNLELWAAEEIQRLRAENERLRTTGTALASALERLRRWDMLSTDAWADARWAREDVVEPALQMWRADHSGPLPFWDVVMAAWRAVRGES